MNVRPPGGEGGKKKPCTRPSLATLEASQNSIRGESSSPKFWERPRLAVVHFFEWLLFEPTSKTQTEQLGRKIFDYGLTNRRSPEPTVLYVPEMAVRFKVPQRNIRQALELLAEQGGIERTNSKDHWLLKNRLSSPTGTAYNPPQASAPDTNMLPNPPPG